MNVTLAAAQKQFLRTGRVARYGDASEVVRVALRVMEAAKSAREDLRSIMAGVKAIDAAKATLRERLLDVRRDFAANSTRRDG